MLWCKEAAVVIMVYNVSGSLSSEQQCVLFSRRLLASEYNIVSED